MTRIAIYARYSSENQKDTSIEDQVRVCRERAAKEGWQVVRVYTDYAISGAFLITRPGINELIRDAATRQFDIVLTEALDRLSRDQEDIAGLYKKTQFFGVSLFSLSEGEISALHVGLKGTMNALFLKDLAAKVKRGQRGRIENGKAGGGNAFGYDVIRAFDARGERIRGERSINPEQATVVRRIFDEYLKGRSAKAIASKLNAEGVPGPTDVGWSQSTINGNWQRGTGILNNELYVGQLVWNKVSYVKNPATGKPVTRINPESEWIRKEVPELRILDQEVWDSAKAMQKRIRHSQPKFWQAQRPKYLFSQLLKCGCCGGGVAKISQRHYGCAIARNKGESSCTNMRSIRQADLEHTVLQVLQRHLMSPELVATFCEEYTAHLNRLRMERNASLHAFRAELVKLDRQETRMVQAIKDGYANAKLKEDMDKLVARQLELARLLLSTEEAPVLLHPNMALRYREEVTRLVRALNDDAHRHEATELIRSLIDRIVLSPDPASRGMLIDVHGDLAGILNIAVHRSKRDASHELDLKQIRLVAGLPDDRSTAADAPGRETESPEELSDKLVEVNRSHLARRDFNRTGKVVEPGGIEPPTS